MKIDVTNPGSGLDPCEADLTEFTGATLTDKDLTVSGLTFTQSDVGKTVLLRGLEEVQPSVVASTVSDIAALYAVAEPITGNGSGAASGAIYEVTDASGDPWNSNAQNGFKRAFYQWVDDTWSLLDTWKAFVGEIEQVVASPNKAVLKDAYKTSFTATGVTGLFGTDNAARLTSIINNFSDPMEIYFPGSTSKYLFGRPGASLEYVLLPNNLKLTSDPGTVFYVVPSTTGLTGLFIGKTKSQIAFSQLEVESEPLFENYGTSDGLSSNIRAFYFLDSKDVSIADCHCRSLYSFLRVKSDTGGMSEDFQISGIDCANMDMCLQISSLTNSVFSFMKLDGSQYTDSKDHQIYNGTECTDLVFRNLIVSRGVGSTIIWQNEAALATDPVVRNCTFENVTFFGNINSGFFFNNGFDGITIRNVDSIMNTDGDPGWLKNEIIEINGANTIVVDNFLIENCRFGSCGYWFLWHSSYGATNIQFQNCTFEGDISGAYGFGIKDVQGFAFGDCTFDANGFSATTTRMGRIESTVANGSIRFAACKWTGNNALNRDNLRIDIQPDNESNILASDVIFEGRDVNPRDTDQALFFVNSVKSRVMVNGAIVTGASRLGKMLGTADDFRDYVEFNILFPEDNHYHNGDQVINLNP